LDRYLATKDNNYFIIGYDGRLPVRSDVLTQLEASIQDEYFKEINDNDFASKAKWAAPTIYSLGAIRVTLVLQTMYLDLVIKRWN
jgi:hypothetical protein